MGIMQGEPRPAAPLRRDEALAYIIEHIVKHGFSPTLEEIAQGLGGISTARVKELVGQLIKLKRVYRSPGSSQRNIRVTDLSDCRQHVDEALRRLGWSVADVMGDLLHPFPNQQLPRVPRLREDPDQSGEPA